MIIINSKHIIFKNITNSIYNYFRENNIEIKLSNIVEYSNDNLYIFIGINKLITKYPPNYIIYQFEQANSYFLNHKNEKEYNYIFNDKYIDILKNAKQIWDYSTKNIEWLSTHIKIKNIIHIPICFDNNLINHKNNTIQKDIDILFFGSLNKKRKNILNELQKRNSNLIIVIKNNDCWEDELLNLILRSKIILNIHYYENAILEMHRLSYLLNNKSFIISEDILDKKQMNTFENSLIFSPYDKIIDTCIYWLSENNNKKREEIGMNGFHFYKSTFKYHFYLDNFIINYKIKMNNIKNIDYTIQNDTISNDYIIVDQLDSDLEKNNKIKENDKIKENQETIKINERNIKKNIKRKNKNINKMEWYIPTQIQEAETFLTEDKHFILKMPTINDDKLPFVSIITPTKNRRKLFSIPIQNYQNFIYPKHKLEWIIVDDGNEDLKDLFINLKNINYIQIKNRDEIIPIGEKRNICVENSKYDFIVCMDDDDYYPPESILARIKTLIKYPEIGCVGCNSVGVYDFILNKSFLATDGNQYFSEASMAFTKTFWKERNFYKYDIQGEGKYFLQYREKKLIHIPFQFIIIALQHNTNFSSNIRNNRNKDLKDSKNLLENKDNDNKEIKEENKDLSTFLPIEIIFFLETLKKLII